MDLNNVLYPKVSVIVPVYHSEAYLDRCCRSLFSQTIDAIEYLFILDGPSKTAEQIISDVLASYPQRQEWVSIHKHATTRGISCSRQEGHELVNGEYIYHCDSDDWLEVDALRIVYETASKNKADLVFFDYVRHYEATGKEARYSSSHVEHGNISTMDGTLHNILIRRQFVSSQGLTFPQGINWGEDLCMSVLLQILTTKIAYVPQVLYHYNMHDSSFTSDVNEEKYRQLVACPQYVEQELSRLQLSDRYAPLLLQMKYEVKEYYLIHPKLRNVRRWCSLYPECHSAIWRYASVPFYLKCLSWLAVHHMQKLVEILLLCRDWVNRYRC